MENQAIALVSTIRPQQIDALLKTGALDAAQVKSLLALAEMVQKAEEEQAEKHKAEKERAVTGASPGVSGASASGVPAAKN
jgi:hypothetical protein